MLSCFYFKLLFISVADIHGAVLGFSHQLIFVPVYWITLHFKQQLSAPTAWTFLTFFQVTPEAQPLVTTIAGGLRRTTAPPSPAKGGPQRPSRTPLRFTTNKKTKTYFLYFKIFSSVKRNFFGEAVFLFFWLLDFFFSNRHWKFFLFSFLKIKLGNKSEYFLAEGLFEFFYLMRETQC